MQSPAKSKRQTGNPDLIAFMRETIAREGPVTFEWFMQQALYHPEHGYYSSGRARIGRRGDYFTNVSVGSAFAELLARQFREMWETLGRPNPFTIVEQGAHSAQFAGDVLNFVSRAMAEFAAALHYYIVEPFPRSERPIDCSVRWCTTLDELEPFCGVHFSNELLDAMPVHRVALQDSAATRRNLTGLTRQVPPARWQETFVDEQDGQFTFVRGPLSSSALCERLQRVPSALPTPYESEVNLRVDDWLALTSRKLTRGYVLAVDYGYPRAEYFAPHRRTGTLRCYAQHRVLDSPLSHVGEADITSHVEWTGVAQHALSAGLEIAGFTDQHHFLTGILSTLAERDVEAMNRNQLQTLVQPTMLGSTFQFLGLSKGAPADAQLSGFKFARDPQIALGLAELS